MDGDGSVLAGVSVLVLPGVAEDGRMAFGRDSVPDLTGETTVITGANGGLGLQTARVFASKGARVVMAVHDQVKAAGAVEEFRAETPRLVWNWSSWTWRRRCR